MVNELNMKLPKITSFNARETAEAVRIFPTKLPEALTVLAYMREVSGSNIS
jgi:hypothetical protein